MPMRCWINDARHSGQAYYTGRCTDRLSHVDPSTVSMAQQMLSYFIPQQMTPYGLSGNAGFSFHWIKSSSCLLFCCVLTYSFIHNGMCIVVSGCLVIAIQLETEHVLNKQKLIRLILFPVFFFVFFFPKHATLLIQFWNMNSTVSWLLSWLHVTDNNGITLKIMELSHSLPLQSPHVDGFEPCCSNFCK